MQPLCKGNSNPRQAPPRQSPCLLCSPANRLAADSAQECMSVIRRVEIVFSDASGKFAEGVVRR